VCVCVCGVCVGCVCGVCVWCVCVCGVWCVCLPSRTTTHISLFRALLRPRATDTAVAITKHITFSAQALNGRPSEGVSTSYDVSLLQCSNQVLPE